MIKAPLLVIAAAATLFAVATPALAHDGPSFSFGIVVGDDDGYRRPPPRYYERERIIEHEPCDNDDRDRSGYYGRPYGYGPRERVVIIDRGREHWHHRHWYRDRDWD
jgi:hypothetical protein